MVFCPNCGTSVNKKDLFCRNCGVSLEPYEEKSNQIDQQDQKNSENYSIEVEDELKDMAFVTISVGKEELFEDATHRKEENGNFLDRESDDEKMPVIQLGLSEDLDNESFQGNPFFINEKINRRDLIVKWGVVASVLLVLVVGGIVLSKITPDFLAKITSNHQLIGNNSDVLDQPIMEQESSEAISSSNQTLVFKEIDEKMHEPVVKFTPIEEGETSQLTELDIAIKTLFSEIVGNYEGSHALYFQKLTDSEGNFIDEQPLVINSEAFPAEGLIKLMTMLTYYQKLKEGTLDSEQTYTLAADDIVGGIGDLQNQQLGTVYTLEELAELMVIDSDNTAMNVLVDYVGGLDAVNQVIQSYGFTKSVLNHKILIESNSEHNYIAVDELGFLLSQLYRKQLVQENYDHDMLIMLNRQRDNSMLTENMPDELIYYNKTGNSIEYGVKNDAAIIETVKGTYILISLNAKVGISEEENEVFRQLMQQFGKQVYDTVIAY